MNLAQNIEDLLSIESDFGKLRNAANEYYANLSAISGIGDDSENGEDDEPTILKSGKAISPKDAARCVLDFARTSAFLRGINSAIDTAKKRFPSEKIEILYAGCGPFAPLAIPFGLKFSADEICFTLIDIHAPSIDSAERIFQTLDLKDFIGEFIQTDAALFQAANGKKFHIIITETMQKALEKEPQVAITLNLAKQLRENGIFIPQKILIEACLADFQKEFTMSSGEKLERRRINLGNIFELSVENSTDENTLFLPKILEIPSGIKTEMCLMLLTKIEIFDSFRLDDYDSGITYASILRDFTEIEAGQKIEFRYIRGENPHFAYRLI